MPLRPPAGYIRPGYNPLQVANAPTVGTASAGDTTASVAFTAPSNVGGGAISLYYAVSSPGQFTGTSVTSPVTVTGLTNGTSYTFTVWAANPFGPSPYSASSNSVTPSFTYIEDVFSTWLYTGNGSTQTITNGIDLSGKGGLVWVKSRSNAQYHALNDTARGAGKVLQSQSTDASINQGSDGLSAFTSSGFSVGMDGGYNNGTWTYASWTFRKQAKFFDVVTWTGNGANPRQIAHNLGSVPGCIIVKSTTRAENWTVYHRSLGNAARMALNTTDGQVTGTGVWGSTTPTSTHFTVSADNLVNFNGDGYVAYLFAHDAGGFGLTGADNVITCGSYTGNSSSDGPVINLGYEPQWVMIKRTESSFARGWYMFDNMRGVPTGSADAVLLANTSAAETTADGELVTFNATGFQVHGGVPSVNYSDSYIYIAIRRGPMKTPTSGTSVFAPVTWTSVGGSNISTNFPVDMQISKRAPEVENFNVQTRLIGLNTTPTNLVNQPYLITNTNSQQQSSTKINYNWRNNGFFVGDDLNGSIAGYGWAISFQRAPGFFDVVCYTGDGATTRYFDTNLGVPAELILLKRLTVDQDWYVRHKDLGLTGFWPNLLQLNTTSATIAGTSSLTIDDQAGLQWGVRDGTTLNVSGRNYVAYLFASCPGVSKVGSYTGNGSSQTIDCGFTGGARMVLIKRTNTTGDWVLFDSARGIVAGNDPALYLNSNAAQLTTRDAVDADSTGFIVNQTDPLFLNVNGASYIFLAIA